MFPAIKLLLGFILTDLAANNPASLPPPLKHGSRNTVTP
jgi:hypothetical protein